MNDIQPSENDLRDQLNELRHSFPRLKDDDLFLVWFLRAFITESEDEAVKSLTGISGDKSVDAVFIDEPARIVFIEKARGNIERSGARWPFELTQNAHDPGPRPAAEQITI